MIIGVINIILGIAVMIMFLMNVKLFYLINAKRYHRKYIGFLLQHTMLNSGEKRDEDVFDIFPISYIVKLFGRDDNQWGNEINILYLKKYKIELSFWILAFTTMAFSLFELLK